MTSNIHRHALGALAISSLLLLQAGCEANSAEPPDQPAPANGAALPASKVATPEPVKPSLPEALPALTGDHFGVWDLRHNLPLAHRIERVGEHIVAPFDTTAPDFIRYVNGNYPNDWMIGVTVDDVKSAGIKARKANLWVPTWRPTAGPQALQLRVNNPANGANKLEVTFNGKKAEAVALEKGWQTISVTAPEGSVSHENHIELMFSNMGRINGKLSGGAIAWGRLGPAAALADAKDAPAFASLATAETLSLEKQGGYAFHTWAVPGSKLALTVNAKTGCGVDVEVLGQDGKGGATSRTRQERHAIEGRGDSQETMVDLTEIAGKSGELVRLELTAAKACEGPVTLSRAELVVPGTRPERPKVAPPKRILFWMIDTLRADHLPFINPDTDVEAPALAQLAKEGALFNLAFVQGNESKVSHASLFSGMYPNRHRVLAKGKLKPEHFIMPEAIKKLGMKTGAHIANGYISEPWGFMQGWDHFRNNLREGGGIDGFALKRWGMKFAKANKDKNFFLYLGTIDPHVTYRAHDGIIEKYFPGSYNGPYRRSLLGTELGKIRGGKAVSDRDKKRAIALYKNEITYNDQAFAEMRKELEELDLWKDTMVVVTADHGDEFWEHGSVGHGHNIHQELVHVPLIITYPGMIPENSVVDAGVDVLDVYPTIVDALGGTRPDGLQGKSLIDLALNRHGGYPQPAIATRYLGHYTMQMQQWKLYLRKGDYRLYERGTDPKELTDVAAKYPLASRWLVDSLSWFRSNRGSWDKQTWGVPSNLSPEFWELREAAAKK